LSLTTPGDSLSDPLTLSAAPAANAASLASHTIRKLRFRILPFVFLVFIVAMLDRLNIGFAALTMNQELGISGQQFGLLFGVFFFGYFLFEIPSNLLMHKIGARVWIARILLSWGLVAMLTGLVRNVHQLYLARFLLGLAEAGYFPGMALYLTYWFPRREHARAVALLIAASPVTSIVGAPLSGFILDHVHWLGVSSWRWLLILEGAPAILFGILTYFVLPSRPQEAKFLSTEEKTWLQSELSREEGEKLGLHRYSVFQAMKSGRVWQLAVTYFGMMVGNYVLQSWTPQLVKSVASHYSNSIIGVLVMIPNLLGLVAMIVVSHHSDRTLERRWHVALSAIAAASALILLSTTSSPLYIVVFLCLLAVGVFSHFGPFWALPSEFLTGYSAAAGIALINSIGNLGGFAGPYTIGLIATRSGSLSPGLATAGVPLFISALLIVLLPRNAAAGGRKLNPQAETGPS
jgi:MFS transporter, ACS family, tartrate transporter